jgi:hypothetical protein
VGGFALDGTGIQATQSPVVPSYLPVIDSPASRRQPLSYPAVVLPITASVRSGRIASRHELCEHFLVQADATIILNGVGQDRQIEPLWNWITSDDFVTSMRSLRPSAVWTPNFSMFADCPRTNDLHSMKRIAICADRIAASGVAPVLHLNGRTPHDYLRWRRFLSDSRIELVAFEFHSMTKDRQRFHCAQLCHLARQYDQPLTLFVRGAGTFLPSLADAFERVIVVDTLALQLARRRHYLSDVGTRLTRRKGWSLTSEPVDRFAQENVSVSAAFYERHMEARTPFRANHPGAPLHMVALS